MSDLNSKPSELLGKVRQQKPLVHHITNWVTIYDCANIVRAFGGLPVMAHAPEEVEQMSGIANALVLNIGTLTTGLIDSMILAGKAANKKGIPVVLDAVGVGATDMRTESALRILKEVHVDIIKGNSSEIGVLAGAEAEVRGVEAAGLKGDPFELSKSLALSEKAVVVMTGKEDIVSDGKNTYSICNGHEMMASIVGTGCMAASVIGCFAAVESDYGLASACAMACYGVAGEMAAEGSSGPGTYKIRFYDEVHNLSRKHVETMSKIIRI
ncbi:MAG: hydroxyethylthiazole kinase [Candidatus Altiarchaeota archaeon]